MHLCGLAQVCTLYAKIKEAVARLPEIHAQTGMGPQIKAVYDQAKEKPKKLYTIAAQTMRSLLQAEANAATSDPKLARKAAKSFVNMAVFAEKQIKQLRDAVRKKRAQNVEFKKESPPSSWCGACD